MFSSCSFISNNSSQSFSMRKDFMSIWFTSKKNFFFNQLSTRVFYGRVYVNVQFSFRLLYTTLHMIDTCHRKYYQFLIQFQTKIFPFSLHLFFLSLFLFSFTSLSVFFLFYFSLLFLSSLSLLFV